MNDPEPPAPAMASVQPLQRQPYSSTAPLPATFVPETQRPSDLIQQPSQAVAPIASPIYHPQHSYSASGHQRAAPRPFLPPGCTAGGGRPVLVTPPLRTAPYSVPLEVDQRKNPPPGFGSQLAVSAPVFVPSASTLPVGNAEERSEASQLSSSEVDLLLGDSAEVNNPIRVPPQKPYGIPLPAPRRPYLPPSNRK